MGERPIERVSWALRPRLAMHRREAGEDSKELEFGAREVCCGSESRLGVRVDCIWIS